MREGTSVSLNQRFSECSEDEQRLALAFIGQRRVLLRSGDGTGTIHTEFTRGECRGMSTMIKHRFPEGAV